MYGAEGRRGGFGTRALHCASSACYSLGFFGADASVFVPLVFFFSLPVRLCPAPRGKCEGEGRRAASKGAPVTLCFLFFLCLFFFGASLCKADAYVFCVLFRFRSLQIALCPAPRRRRQGTKGKHANFKGNDFLFFLGWSCVKFAAHPLVFRCCCFYGLLCPSSSGPSLHK